MVKRATLIVLLIINVVLLIGFFLFLAYYVFDSEDYTGAYEERISRGEILNPSLNLTDEEAAVNFDESFIYYLLVNIKAYNLHDSASKDSPKIELVIGNKTFNAVISGGEIRVSKGVVRGEDIRIVTSVSEAVKMVRDKNYIEESFNLGLSRIELIAGKPTLFSKGYLKIYTELTGKSITGGVIKAYFS